jgi:hypothetical protein
MTAVLTVGLHLRRDLACRGDSLQFSLDGMTGVKCMAVLKALSEMNRLRIVRMLLNEQLGVNAISDRLRLSQKQ